MQFGTVYPKQGLAGSPAEQRRWSRQIKGEGEEENGIARDGWGSSPGDTRSQSGRRSRLQKGIGAGTRLGGGWQGGIAKGGGWSIGLSQM